MVTYHLHKWSLTSTFDPWRAPEAASKQLQGCRDDEDRTVVTSRIVKVDGRTITTYSGSVYILEEIDDDYLRWMKDHGYEYDPDNPIKIKG